MTDAIRDKWDARYRDRDATEAAPCRVLAEFRHLLPGRGRALDAACGLGGNAQLLAGLGLDTEAWDLSPVAVNKLNAHARARGLPLTATVHDVEETPPEKSSFDVIVVSYFLNRALASPLVEALRPNGLLFYQTFTREAVEPSGPSNPDFRLAPNELLRLFSTLRLVAYREEGFTGEPTLGLRNEAYLIGIRQG